MGLSDTDYQLMLGASGVVITVLLILVYFLSKRQKEECTEMMVTQASPGTYGGGRDREAAASSIILAPPSTLTKLQQAQVEQARLNAFKLRQGAQEMVAASNYYYDPGVSGYYNPRASASSSQFD